MTIHDERAFDPRAELFENCRHCVNGLRTGLDGFTRDCTECGGTARRRRRGLHHAESAIDYEPAPDTAPRFVARIAALAERYPNDADLGAAVRALLGDGS
jgi:hypothetical protein